MVSVDFPGASPGHHVVHWAWAGDVDHPEGKYFDVVDVNVHAEVVPTAEIYGGGEGGGRGHFLALVPSLHSFPPATCM